MTEQGAKQEPATKKLNLTAIESASSIRQLSATFQVRERELDSRERELAVQYEAPATGAAAGGANGWMRAQQQALAAKAQTEERTKTAELEEALVRSRQREQELTRQVQEEKRKQLTH